MTAHPRQYNWRGFLKLSLTVKFIWCTLRVHFNFKLSSMVTKLIGVKEFRQNMAKYSAKAKKHGWRYVVLNRNVPIFEVKPLSKKDTILEKLAADIAEARADVKAGRVYSAAEVRKHLWL